MDQRLLAECHQRVAECVAPESDPLPGRLWPGHSAAFPGISAFLRGATHFSRAWSLLCLGTILFQRGKLEACTLSGVPEAAFCGTLEVYEDRGAARGRQIGLRVVVLAAFAETPQPDPVFVFSGGPGQASSEFAENYAEDLAEARKTRDLGLIDRRGTGSSNPLDCSTTGPQRGTL